MNIVIFGGTGFIGQALAEALKKLGHSVSTHGRAAFTDVSHLSTLLENQQVVIQLAGANIGTRWSKSYKNTLYESRINTNQLLAQALDGLSIKPLQVITASAVGIYPQSNCGQGVDESCTDIDPSFLGQLGRDWEASSMAIHPTPLVMRLGVVLGKQGGALQKMLPAFKLGGGGPIAGGQQCFSWVHLDDVIAAFIWALAQPELTGPINITAPNPVTQRTFGCLLAKTLHRPFIFPMPEWVLKILFGEGAQVLTYSSCVLPTRLTQAGFKFTYPDAESALIHILKS